MRPADDAAAKVARQIERREVISHTAAAAVLDDRAELVASAELCEQDNDENQRLYDETRAELARLKARIAALTPMVLGPEHEYIAGEWLHRGDVLDLLGGSE